MLGDFKGKALLLGIVFGVRVQHERQEATMRLSQGTDGDSFHSLVVHRCVPGQDATACCQDRPQKTKQLVEDLDTPSHGTRTKQSSRLCRQAGKAYAQLDASRTGIGCEVQMLRATLYWARGNHYCIKSPELFQVAVAVSPK
eukprot:1282754-Amphidinium_carterae.1